MQVLLPREHRELSAACAAGVQRGRLEEALDELKRAMAMQGLAGDLSGRPKNLWGVFSKMRAKNYDLDQVYDARALRIVAGSKAECYGILRLVRPCLLGPTVALLVHGPGAGLQHWHYGRNASAICLVYGGKPFTFLYTPGCCPTAPCLLLFFIQLLSAIFTLLDLL